MPAALANHIGESHWPESRCRRAGPVASWPGAGSVWSRPGRSRRGRRQSNHHLEASQTGPPREGPRLAPLGRHGCTGGVLHKAAICRCGGGGLSPVPPGCIWVAHLSCTLAVLPSCSCTGKIVPIEFEIRCQQKPGQFSHDLAQSHISLYLCEKLATLACIKIAACSHGAVRRRLTWCGIQCGGRVAGRAGGLPL